MFEPLKTAGNIINQDLFIPLGYISMAGINLSLTKEDFNDGEKGGCAASPVTEPPFSP